MRFKCEQREERPARGRMLVLFEEQSDEFTSRVTSAFTFDSM